MKHEARGRGPSAPGGQGSAVFLDLHHPSTWSLMFLGPERAEWSLSGREHGCRREHGARGSRAAGGSTVAMGEGQQWAML